MAKDNSISFLILRRIIFVPMLITGLFSVKACSEPEQKNTDVANIQTVTTDFAIIEYDTADKWTFKNVKPATLSNEEVDLVFKIFKEAVEDYNKEMKIDAYRIRPLSTYKKQLVPVINKNGEKEVWLNCFCSDHANWKKELIEVKDGGNCYFNLKINLKEKKSYEFAVNGDA